MNCASFRAAVVEAARSGAQPDAGLRQHLTACAECRERWESEQCLSGALSGLRSAVAGERTSEFGRARTMREFKVGLLARPRAPRWAAAAAAAVIVLAAVSLLRTGSTATRTTDQVAVYQVEEGFVPVPYSQPFAEGEVGQIIRTELTVAGLGRMGITMPAPYEPVEADVLVGADGLPHAVRILDYDF